MALDWVSPRALNAPGIRSTKSAPRASRAEPRGGAPAIQARYGHSLAHLSHQPPTSPSVVAPAHDTPPIPGTPAGHRAIQRVIFREQDKKKTPYKQLGRADWYQNLNAKGRKLADALHAETKKYTRSQAIQIITSRGASGEVSVKSSAVPGEKRSLSTPDTAPAEGTALKRRRTAERGEEKAPRQDSVRRLVHVKRAKAPGASFAPPAPEGQAEEERAEGKGIREETAEEERAEGKRARKETAPATGRGRKSKAPAKKLEIEPAARKGLRGKAMQAPKRQSGRLRSAAPESIDPVVGTEGGKPWMWVSGLTVQVSGKSVEPHFIHTWNAASTKQVFYGSYTLVFKNSEPRPSKNTHSWTPTAEEHTEPQYFAWVQKQLAAEELEKTDIAGVILEVNQTNTPCSGAECRPRILADWLGLDLGGALYVVRMSANKMYETQPPKTPLTSFTAKNLHRRGTKVPNITTPSVVHGIPRTLLL